MIQAILFDLDGTIVDSEKMAARVLKESFSFYGQELLEEDLSLVVGRKFEAVLEKLFQKYPISTPLVLFQKQMEQMYRVLLKKESVLVHGIRETLASFQNKIPQMGMVTGSSEEETLCVLETFSLKEFFSFWITSEQYQESKPSSESYFLALKKLQLPARKVLVFEDSTPGIQAAREAGMWVVAVQSANHFGHSQKDAHAQIHDFSGINMQWLEALPFLSKNASVV